MKVSHRVDMVGFVSMADRIGTEVKSDSEKTKVKRQIVRGTRYLNICHVCILL